MRHRGVDGTLVVGIVIIFLGCSESNVEESRAPSPQATNTPAVRVVEDSGGGATGPADSDAIARGRAVYSANCTACHNPDPSLPGSLGPEVSGSSLELLEARLLHNSYPDGYTPKRDSRVMMALPYLKDDIAPLAAYLADPGSR